MARLDAREQRARITVEARRDERVEDREEAREVGGGDLGEGPPPAAGWKSSMCASAATRSSAACPTMASTAEAAALSEEWIMG